MRPALSLVLALALAAPAKAENMTVLTGIIDFNTYVADKPWRGSGGDKGVLRKNGTWTATINRQRGSGTWVWLGKFWCRQGTLGGQPLKTDCQLLHANKTHFSITRNEGKGETTVYRFTPQSNY